MKTESKLTPLCELARKHETDKGGWHMRYGGGDSDTCHNYTPYYHAIWSQRREEVLLILEIGINAGCSLRMWEEYFPNALICGIDCDPHCLVNKGRIRSFLADQNNPQQLRDVVSQISNELLGGVPARFDMIVDDGSHEPSHQIVSATTLLPFVAKKGCYVIEDIGVYGCNPAPLIDKIDHTGFRPQRIACGVGIGKAHCWCSYCGGKGDEALILFTRR